MLAGSEKTDIVRIQIAVDMDFEEAVKESIQKLKQHRRRGQKGTKEELVNGAIDKYLPIGQSKNSELMFYPGVQAAEEAQRAAGKEVEKKVGKKGGEGRQVMNVALSRERHNRVLLDTAYYHVGKNKLLTSVIAMHVNDILGKDRILLEEEQDVAKVSPYLNLSAESDFWISVEKDFWGREGEDARDRANDLRLEFNKFVEEKLPAIEEDRSKCFEDVPETVEQILGTIGPLYKPPSGVKLTRKGILIEEKVRLRLNGLAAFMNYVGFKVNLSIIALSVIQKIAEQKQK